MYCISPYDKSKVEKPIEIKLPEKELCRIFTKEKGIVFSQANVTGIYIGNCINLSDDGSKDIIFRFFINEYDTSTCILKHGSYWKVMIGD